TLVAAVTDSSKRGHGNRAAANRDFHAQPAGEIVAQSALNITCDQRCHSRGNDINRRHRAIGIHGKRGRGRETEIDTITLPFRKVVSASSSRSGQVNSSTV